MHGTNEHRQHSDSALRLGVMVMIDPRFGLRVCFALPRILTRSGINAYMKGVSLMRLVFCTHMKCISYRVPGVHESGVGADSLCNLEMPSAVFELLSPI